MKTEPSAPPPAPPSVFDAFVATTFRIEGDGRLSMDREDPGNWTGGAVGHGVLRGSRFGISAAAFPDVDLEHLDRGYATGLAYARYWLPAKCAAMPQSLAMLMFDAAFQHGPESAAKMLQRALGLRDDGDLGRITMGAVEQMERDGAIHVRALCIAFQAQRLLHMVRQPSWTRDANGLAVRLCTLLIAAAHFPDTVSGGVA